MVPSLFRHRVATGGSMPVFSLLMETPTSQSMSNICHYPKVKCKTNSRLAPEAMRI